MTDPGENELVKAVARDVVLEIAPQERPVFSAYSEAYFKSPEQALRASTGKDDALGFGVEVVIPMLTPIVLAVTSEVVRYVGQELGKAVVAGGARLGTAAVSTAFKTQAAAPAREQGIPPLSQEQAKEVRKIAFDKALALKLSPDQANLLADSMVGSLRLAPVSS
jgi:hypothetical protein